MNITELIQEKQLIISRLEKMIYGSMEIREKENKKYLYVHYRFNGILRSKYVGEYNNELANLIMENNQLAMELKKRLKKINKELDAINYESKDLSDDVLINLSVARKNLVDSIYKQAILEGVATTYSDTETIVNGGKVMNMTANDISKVVNLKRAWEFILNEDVISYPTNYAVLCQINQIVEDGFSSIAGRLRNVPVSIEGSSYMPPIPIEENIKEELNEILSSNQSVIDITIELLLFVMKKQIFLDGNKRTAVIFANHYLISHAEGIIVIPAELVPEYKRLLIAYYERNNNYERNNDYENNNNDIKSFLKNRCYIKLR